MLLEMEVFSSSTVVVMVSTDVSQFIK